MPETERLSPQAKADIQGFITSGYGHLPCGAFLFVEIRDPQQARTWLSDLLPHVATAASWRPHRDAEKIKPNHTLNIAFTYAGLQKLDLPDSALNTFPVEFCEGMASEYRARILGDTGESAPEQWELGGPTDAARIHVVLMLNAATRAGLDAWGDVQRTAIRRANGGVIELKNIAQHGERPLHGKEPFGFFDGVAQPDIKGIKGEGVNTGEFILGYRNEYDFLPVSPLAPIAEDWQGLLPKPANPNYASAGYRDLGFNGSFIVYRKLHQDVAGFWRFLQEEAMRYTGASDPEFMVWLGAKLVGRWPSGAPLVVSPIHDQPEHARRDDFLYATADPLGLACPLGAHIRRTNPRDAIRPSGPRESLHMTARHRILRRGKPYGDPLFDLTALDRPRDRDGLKKAILDLQDDGKPRGIHFLCINASLKSQFEFVQQAWTNNPHFNGLTLYPPAPSGGAGRALDPAGSLYVPGSPFGLRTSPLPQFVTTRGGAYFFMPSLTALRFLAAMRTSGKP